MGKTLSYTTQVGMVYATYKNGDVGDVLWHRLNHITFDIDSFGVFRFGLLDLVMNS